jgi:RNA polymerase sigma factor (sigma-70 family)
MLNDEQLVNACIAGERSAQYQLYERYSGKLFAMALRYIKDRENAQDVLQNAYIKIFENIGKFRFECPLEAWMRRIVINTALRSLKSNKEHEDINAVDFALSEASYAENMGLENLKFEQLTALIHTLPDGCRTIFNMFAIDGYKHQEIAEILGINEGTSKSQYARAKELLVRKLELEQKIFSNRT